IDEICARAGFTRGAFYSNFRTVDDVFFAMYERKTAALLESLHRHAVAHRPTALAICPSDDTLEVAVDALLAIVPADAQWYALRALYGLRAAADPALSQVLREHGEAFQAGFIPVLIQIADAVGGELRPNVEEAARVVTAAHVGSVLQGAFADDPAQLRRDTVLAALRGVLRSDSPATARPPQE
nr:TetR/AcrR family transcriptional regulator [Leucobacter sp.]